MSSSAETELVPDISTRAALSKRTDPSTDSQYAAMIRGELYHAFTPAFNATRAEASALCHEFNNKFFTMTRVQRLNIIRSILGQAPLPNDIPNDDPSLDSLPWIEPPFRADYGLHVTLGENVFINFNCTILDTCHVTIGARTLIGPNVSFYAATHPIDPALRDGTKGPESGKEIIIGEDCWFGGSVVVLSGVKIGQGVTVGAGAVVTKNVEPFCIVAGNPARVIKRLPVPEGWLA